MKNHEEPRNLQSEVIELQNYPTEIPKGRIARFMGIYIYSYRPKAMRLARVSDLFFIQNLQGSPLLAKRGVNYMIESFVTPGHFHVYTMREEHTFEDLKPWFAEGRIWVKDETGNSSPSSTP